MVKPFLGKRVIMCGKGGCGKSTILVLLVDILKDKGYEIHVVDGDASNFGLSQMLGFDKEPKPLIDYFGGKTFKDEEGKVTCPVDDPSPLDKEKMDLKKIPPEYFIRKNNITLFSVGKIPGEQVTLIDIEAGIEHFGRGIDINSDAVLVVVDPNYTSFQIAESVEKMVAEMKINAGKLAEKMVEKLGSEFEIAKAATKDLRIKYAWSILNKVDSPEIESIMKEKLNERGIEPIGSIHYDPKISRSFLEGVPLESNVAKEDIEEIVNHIEELIQG
jgi:CO dehydrogenase maturation factor